MQPVVATQEIASRSQQPSVGNATPGRLVAADLEAVRGTAARSGYRPRRDHHAVMDAVAMFEQEAARRYQR